MNSLVLFRVLFLKNKRILYAIAVPLLFIVTGFLQHGAELLILDIMNINMPAEAPGLNLTGYVLLFFCLLSVTYAFINQWAKDQQTKKKIEQENLLKEVHFLRSQINPHFLFNTINSLFWIANKNQDKEMSEGLSLLAEMMRYMLDGDQGELKRLDREIEYIESYVKLQKIRFEDDNHSTINFDKKGSFKEWYIHPTILISFVENAFKHGIKNNGVSIIDIIVEMKDKLYLSVINTIGHNSVEESTGIGIDNVIKRLNLLYKDSYQLEMNRIKDTFEVKLTIELEKL